MTFMLNRGITEALFEGFYIQRWNDRIRPVHLTEADKNASKMMIVLWIGKQLEDRCEQINWTELVEKGVLDALLRYAVSDISSVVHAKLRQNHAVYVDSMTKIIDKRYGEMLPPDFLERLRAYVREHQVGPPSREDQMMRLAHRLALRLELKIISSLGYGSFFLEHEEDADAIDAEINNLAVELGLGPLLGADGRVASSELNLLLKLIDRLRYQTRWSQTPRLPQTSVLGHSMYVAGCVYFSVRNRYGAARVVNDFFAALMHDFLESLTRDIISPVKNSSVEFKLQIAEIEEGMLEHSLLPSFHGKFRDYVRILLTNEFANRAVDGGASLEFGAAPDESKFDGQVVLAADYYAALLEADQSIRLGITSHHLVDAISRLHIAFKSMESEFEDKEVYRGFWALYKHYAPT